MELTQTRDCEHLQGIRGCLTASPVQGAKWTIWSAAVFCTNPPRQLAFEPQHLYCTYPSFINILLQITLVEPTLPSKGRASCYGRVSRHTFPPCILAPYDMFFSILFSHRKWCGIPLHGDGILRTREAEDVRLPVTLALGWSHIAPAPASQSLKLYPCLIT